MMRTPDSWAVAVRKRDGSIHRERHEVAAPAPSAPFLRGPATIVGAVRVGMHAVRIAIRETLGAEPTSEQMATTFGAGGVAVLAIFIAAPGVLIGSIGGIGGAAVEAAARAAMLVAYLAIVSRSAQTRAIFRYHGAEHKTIAAFERSGTTPSLEQARAMSPVHGRCGSTFIALFVIVAGVVYAFVPRHPLWAGALIRIALAPVVVALAYELMRAAAREPDAMWSRVVTLPGRLLQRITTREPDEPQLEVAIAALETLLA